MSAVGLEVGVDQLQQPSQPLELRICYAGYRFGSGFEDKAVLLSSWFLNSERQSFIGLARSAGVGVELRLVDYVQGFCKMSQWIDGWHITFDQGTSTTQAVDYLRKVLARSLTKENPSTRIAHVRVPRGRFYEDILQSERILYGAVVATDFEKYDRELNSHSL